jgi:hypothetical protein
MMMDHGRQPCFYSLSLSTFSLFACVLLLGRIIPSAQLVCSCFSQTETDHHPPSSSSLQWGPTVTRARTHYLLTSQSLLLGVNSPVVALRRNGCGVTSGKPEIVACPFCTCVPFPLLRNHFLFVCLLGITAPLFLSWNKSSYAWIN